MRGKLIAIEGSDGSGKETQSKLLEKYLQSELSFPVMRISFPNYNSLSSGPVQIYLNHSQLNLSQKQIHSLYAIDRLLTFRQLNLDAYLSSGGWIIADRYVGSSLVYQTVDVENKDEMITHIKNVEYKENQLPEPDMTIFLDMDRGISKMLVESRGEALDNHEKNDVFLRKVYINGLEIAQIEGWNVIKCYDENKKPIDLFDISNLIREQIRPLIDEFKQSQSIDLFDVSILTKDQFHPNVED